MLRMKDRNIFLGKRSLDVHLEPEEAEDAGSPAKQMCQGLSFLKRLQNVNNDRQEASGVVQWHRIVTLWFVIGAQTC